MNLKVDNRLSHIIRKLGKGRQKVDAIDRQFTVCLHAVKER